MVRHGKLSTAFAGLASLSLAATPVAAAELPAPTTGGPVQADPAWSDASVTAERSRRHHYRDRYRHRHHRNRGIDAGDVIAGVLILGGIAAVASAIDNDRNEPRRGYRGPVRVDRSNGLDRAAQMCVAEIERDARVASVDGVDRTPRGWQVNGALYDGEGFTCHIGNDGRIDDIDYGRRGVTYRTQASDAQYGDDVYSAAWNSVDSGPASSVRPAYPGGPLPGEAGYDDY
ncbi:hypothetical protein AM2010_531 [Pelagerythrobacter marensis]|uniref:Secreted protein n=1 Tax=Pelagerythrobacter marensis TaxID=543877 RepID=A0A0G3X8E5_9SPHN|nr:hypothetical protein AM2010_531 [Pelagerythrobacter marensis]